MTSPYTTDQVLAGVDLTGRVAVVTGASSGLGVETARALARAGATVIAAVRDVDKARAALPAEVEIVGLDLADLDSVRATAAAIAAVRPRIDLLINNAGVMASPLMRTTQGFELQLGTNHLGHFVFTTALLGRLGEGSRIVNLSSGGHVLSGMRWEDPNFADETSYDKWIAYGQSKTANVLFTVELERRLARENIHAFAVHPGVIGTELSRHLTRADYTTLGGLEITDAAHGAATTVWAAVSADADRHGGRYLAACAAAEPHAHAVDPDEAARLWEWSETVTGTARSWPSTSSTTPPSRRPGR